MNEYEQHLKDEERSYRRWVLEPRLEECDMDSRLTNKLKAHLRKEPSKHKRSRECQNK